MWETIYRKKLDRFRLCWNNYKESNRKLLRGENIKQIFLREHILRDGHQSFEEDVSICLIDKTDSSDPYKREYYRMTTLKTIASFGLNTEERYWVIYNITRFSSVLLVYIVAKSKLNLIVFSLLCCCFLLSCVTNVTCTVKGINWTIWNRIVKRIELFSLYFVVYVMVYLWAVEGRIRKMLLKKTHVKTSNIFFHFN